MPPARPDRLRVLRPAHRARFRSEVIAEINTREIVALAGSAPPIGGGLAVEDIERDIARLSGELPADDPALIAANECAADAEHEARLWEIAGEVLAKEQS